MAKRSGSKGIKGAVKGFQKTLEVYKPSHLKEVDNTKLARSIAGTSDKKSKEYKAAMRNVQRWKKGTTKPKDAAQKKVMDFIKKSPELKRKLFKPNKPLRVSLNGTDTYDDRERTFTKVFDPETAQKFFDAARESAKAAQEFFYREYGYFPEGIKNPWWSIVEVEE